MNSTKSDFSTAGLVLGVALLLTLTSSPSSSTILDDELFRAGVGASNCHGRIVSQLPHDSDGVGRSSARFGFVSVQSLQDAIRALCGEDTAFGATGGVVSEAADSVVIETPAPVLSTIGVTQPKAPVFAAQVREPVTLALLAVGLAIAIARRRI